MAFSQRRSIERWRFEVLAVEMVIFCQRVFGGDVPRPALKY